MGKYNLNQYDISKSAQRYALENAELRDSKVGFSSKAPRFHEKIDEKVEAEETFGNEVNKIFEQLPTFKAKAHKDVPKDTLVHPKIKDVTFPKVEEANIRMKDSRERRRRMFQVLQLITTRDSPTGISRPSTAITISLKMFTKQSLLIINDKQKQTTCSADRP